ncbi:ATP/GTP-binding protein [Pseudanabaena sp. 'Roaring Creek']|uniref:AAA family ATPase n=1 Tax=Pseudanabaena sp. 'Roaring Creek' TaxID=1681830 RepID=UPI0006D76BF9|nr:AAA family ATPase [Pseudanabaena sp. 'Roaring Creek']
MLKSLKIESFRCFLSFEMQQLGRLNLIVGTNNSGKTSILEALQLLLNKSPNFEVLSDVVINRSEYLDKEEDRDKDLVIRHLFCGHEIEIGSNLLITGKDDINDVRKEITISIDYKEISEDSYLPMLYIKRTNYIKNLTNPDWYLAEESKIELSLSKDGNVSLKSLQDARKSLAEQPSYVQFINSSSLSNEKAIDLFEMIVLTPEEDLVTQAMQIVEPRIKRIATLTSGKHKYKGARSGFVMQLANENQRIPIGSMGDGMWRMLGLALAIVNAKDGVLLVDEIDTGLHFTVMADMWKMLWETAKRLNVQIFATTHSNDCWKSLADIANAENPSEDGITIHRVEKGKPHSIVFTEDEIAIAAEEGIEVR